MRGSSRVLGKVLLFQLDGQGHPQDDATPSFFPDSRIFIPELSINKEFVPEYLLKGDEKLK